MPESLRAGAEHDHAKRLREPVERRPHGGQRHGRRAERGQRRAIERCLQAQGCDVEEKVARLDAGKPHLGIAGRDGGNFDAGGAANLSGHEEEFAAGEGHDRAGDVGGRVEVGKCLGDRIDGGARRERCGDGGRVEVAWRAHRSTNPGVSGSWGSISKVERATR